MTQLRDDGLLETDSAVVAACFLGRDVISRVAIRVDWNRIDEKPFPLRDIRHLGGDFMRGVGDGEGNWWDYPILIPANSRFFT